MQETQVQSLGQEDLPEEGMKTNHYFCRENPIDRGAWQATGHRVTESQAWLNWAHTERLPVGLQLLIPALAVLFPDVFVYLWACARYWVLKGKHFKSKMVLFSSKFFFSIVFP